MSEPKTISERVAALSPEAFAALVGLLEKKQLLEKSSGSARLTAFVSAMRDEDSLTEAQMQGHLSSRVPDYMQPANWVFVESIPRTSNGKVDKARLIAQQRIVATVIDKEGAMVEESPSSQSGRHAEITADLLMIWSDVLGMDEVRPDDNYFELGGDSISAMQIVARASKRELNFTTRELMLSATIERLADRLTQPMSADNSDPDGRKHTQDVTESAQASEQDVEDVLRVLNLGRE